MKIRSVGKCVCLAVDWSSITESEESTKVTIDIRDQQRFGKCRIRSSFNFAVSNLLLRRVVRGTVPVSGLLNVAVKNALLSCSKIIIVDERSRVGCESNELQAVSNALRKEYPLKLVCFLNGGFEEFQKSHPSWCEFSEPKSSNAALVNATTPFTLKIDPSEERVPTHGKDLEGLRESPGDASPVRILPFLYLGNASHASKREILDRYGVTAILNVAKSCPEYFHEVYLYKHIPLEDNDSEDISAHFHEAIKFIDEVRRSHGLVLVHCRAGISRSASICIAYLMKQHEITLDQAYEFTKRRRSSISPNFNFLGQLLAFEAEVMRERRCRNLVACPPQRQYLSSESLTRQVCSLERRVSTGAIPEGSDISFRKHKLGYSNKLVKNIEKACDQHLTSSGAVIYKFRRQYSLPEIQDTSSPTMFTYPPEFVCCSPDKATQSSFTLLLTPS